MAKERRPASFEQWYSTGELTSEFSHVDLQQALMLGIDATGRRRWKHVVQTHDTLMR
jgi:hypothetical protein